MRCSSFICFNTEVIFFLLVTASKKRSEIQFKCVYGSETRVIKTDGDISYDKLCSKIRSSFGHRMNIRYTDKAGDVISVKSDEEFLSMEYRNESVIRVQLTRRRFVYTHR